MNIFDYLESKGIKPKKVTSSGEHASPCPACGGENRFVIPKPETGRWFCRGCNMNGGDLNNLVQLVDGVGYKEACRIIGVTPTARQSKVFTPARQSLKQIEPPPATWQKTASDFIDQAHAELLKNEQVLSWLKFERLIDLETVNRFKLGWNPVDTYAPRQTWGLPDETNPKTGKPKKVWLPKGLVIPCRDMTGQLFRLKIRRPEDAPRYVLTPGSTTASAFFGQITPAFVLVESELDAVLLWQEAGDYTTPVSVGGVSMKPDRATIEALANGDVTLVSFDSDEAGKNPAVISPWQAALKNYQLHPIPPKYGKDHTEAFRAGMDLRAWVVAGLKKLQKKHHTEPEPPAAGWLALGEVENTPKVDEPVIEETISTPAVELLSDIEAEDRPTNHERFEEKTKVRILAKSGQSF